MTHNAIWNVRIWRNGRAAVSMDYGTHDVAIVVARLALASDNWRGPAQSVDLLRNREHVCTFDNYVDAKYCEVI